MIKFLILMCLIIKSNSWTWDDYPSPRGPDYRKCGVTKPAYVCDPDGLLTDQQREEIVELVEDFKEKTKRVNFTPSGRNSVHTHSFHKKKKRVKRAFAVH
ncbi:unnamed protein product [Meloidogyne enterolobii]|uniref:Uncharacterized protein n=1 Tax=Meloidogyne enterolobii TaxID=390850 RepID=A0ACB0YGX8_MELEN